MKIYCPRACTFEALVPGDVDSEQARRRPIHCEVDSSRSTFGRLKSVRAEVASYGLDPDVHAPPLPGPRETIPPPHLLGEYLRELDIRAQQQIRAAEDSKRKLLEDTAAEFAARGESFDHVLKEMATAPTGPPKPRTPDRARRFAQDQRRASGEQHPV